MRELLRNPYFVIVLDEQTAIIRLTRTSEPFGTVEEATRKWLEVSTALDRAGRAGRSLLTDLRLGPARNDPDFERAIRALLPQIHAGLRKNAVLVRLAAGALQIRRHAREDHIERLITSSEEEAYAYVAKERPSEISRR